jgi:hypothetical protein
MQERKISPFAYKNIYKFFMASARFVRRARHPTFQTAATDRRLSTRGFHPHNLSVVAHNSGVLHHLDEPSNSAMAIRALHKVPVEEVLCLST